MIELDQGKYVLRIKAPWKTKDNSDLVITTYSDQEVVLDYLPKERYTKFLEKFYIEEGRLADKYSLGKDCHFASGWEGNNLWLYMQNDSADKNWDLEINFKKMENITLSKRYKLEDMSFKAKLPPKSEKVAILKRNGVEKAVIDWSFKCNWE